MKEARKKNRKHAEVAVNALKDLFVSHILQDSTKLKAFQYNERIKGRTESEIPNFDLVESYFDHCIKEMYREFVTEILTGFAKDDLEYFRKVGLDVLVHLIQNKPEIEEVILTILINKLGDGSKKVQQHTIMVLCQLLRTQPVMAQVIMHETHMLLQRPGLKPVQKYYGVLFLNKIGQFCGKLGEKVRINLFKIYFQLFKEVMKNPEELKEVVFKKDRTKSKKEQIKAKAKALKKIQ